jgi:hypothetical protein
MQNQPDCFRESIAFMWVSAITAVIPSIRAETTAIQAQDDLDVVLIQLRANEVDVESEITKLSKTLNTKKIEIVSKMRTGLSKQMKEKAFATMLPSIRKMKTLQNQQKVTQNRISLVVKQLEAFENGKFQQSIVKTLKQSVMAMKQIGIGTKADEIDDMMGDLDESLLAANDVNEVLSGHNMVSMSNSMNAGDDELMNEFDEWLRSEDIDEGEGVPEDVANLIPPTPPRPIATVRDTKTITDRSTVNIVTPITNYTVPTVVNNVEDNWESQIPA